MFPPITSIRLVGKTFIISTGFPTEQRSTVIEFQDNHLPLFRISIVPTFPTVQLWLLLITSASFLMTLQQLFSIQERKLKKFPFRVATALCKTFSWKIKTFCLQPINHSLFSPFFHRCCLFNEQIETMLNLCYQRVDISLVLF